MERSSKNYSAINPYKKTTLLLFIVLVAWECLPIRTSAQPPYDYQLGKRAFYLSDTAFIRVHSDSNLVLLYNFPNTHMKDWVRVYSGGTMFRKVIDSKFTIHDMATAGGFAFICGRDMSTGNAFWAWLHLSSGAIQFREIDLSSPYSGSCFTNIVAYQTVSGDYKVVLLGASDYNSSGYPSIIQANCPSSLSNFTQQINYSAYTMQFVMEMTMPNPTNPPSTCNIKAIQDMTHREILHDVVLTENYVAFIGLEKISSNRSVTIHKCSRANVLSDFDDYYYYPCAGEDYKWVDPIGCHMKKDTLAIVAMGDDIGNGYSTQIRTFDLSSMNMTCSQMFTFDAFKPFPIDLVYAPASHILILLQLAETPSLMTVFYNLEPYNVSPSYVASVHYDNNNSGRQFYSMDRLPDGDYFASSGGDYLFMKKSSVTQNTATCYNMSRQYVHNKSLTAEMGIHHNFVQCTVPFTLPYYNVTTSNSNLTTECND